MKTPVRILFVLAVFLLAACAPKTQTPIISAEAAHAEALHQMTTAFTSNMAMAARLTRVAFPVLSRNAEACDDDAVWYAGFRSGTSKGKDDIAKEALASLYGMDDKLTVTAVPTGTPADRGGLQVRDKILLVNGEEKGMFTPLSARITDWSGGDDANLKLRIRRGVETLNLNIEGVKACYAPVIVQQDEQVNAFADGSNIMITTGMLKFVESDDELALIIGHEMAHNTMGHSASKIANRMMGALLDATITVLTGVYSQVGAQVGSMAYSQEFEAEADYVGCYYTEKSGYDCKAAAGLWRRMATAHPNAINLQGSTHPSTAKRFLALEKAVEEIEMKKAQGRKLEPEMRH